MTKPIRSYPETRRKYVVERRLKGNSRDLGWIAAMGHEHLSVPNALRAEQGKKWKKPRRIVVGAKAVAILLEGPSTPYQVSLSKPKKPRLSEQGG